MADLPDDPVKFKEAIRSFRKRVPMTDDVFDQLEEDEREFAFTVAGVAQLDVVADVYEAAERAIEDGTTFEDFQDQVGESLTESWGGEQPGRLENIFRTNVLGAYNAGRYEAATAPDVLEDRPYWRFDGPEDSRNDEETCAIIMAAHVILPANDPWWQTHYPLLHFQALGQGTLIVTREGEKPIERVRPGELVLTHRRRWRPVVAVMGKRPDAPRVRRLHLSTGRTLSVSDDHPVLTAGVSGWKLGRDLEVGDVLFHHGEPVSGPREVAIGDPDDHPPLADEGLVPYEIAFLAGSEVVLPVDLDSHLKVQEGEVNDVGTDRVLELPAHAARGDQAHRDPLCVGRRIPVDVGAADCHPVLARIIPGRVAILHSRRVGRHDGAGLLPQAEEVMPGPAPARGLREEDRGLGLLSSDRDSVSSAPRREGCLSKPQGSLNAADRFAAVPVAFLDQFVDSLPVSDVEWFHTAIISIAEDGPQERLWNLSVWEDETYVAEGVIVHNCRHVVTTLSKDQAESQGITDSPPNVEAAPGFGQAPTGGGRDWEPGPRDYPAPLAAELDDKTEDAA